MAKQKKIHLKNVSVHNLKKVSVDVPTGELVVFTGVSGSGKSSLAFDTIYIEGQRRYIDSLSTFARRHMGDMPKPDAEEITGISPTIAIEQKSSGHNPRSTVGTITGIYDYLRLLFSRLGTPHCPISKEAVMRQTPEEITQKVMESNAGKRIVLLSPYVRKKKGEFKEEFANLMRKGFTRIRLDGNVIELSDVPSIDKKVTHDIDLVIDRIAISDSERPRVLEGVTQALNLSEGLLSILNVETNKETLYSKEAYSEKSGKSYPPLEPQNFSFNHPSGMCPGCQGLGVKKEFDIDLIIDPEKTIAEDCCTVASSYTTIRYGNIYNNLARLYKFSVNTPWKELSPSAQKIFLYGNNKKWTPMRFVHPIKKTKWTDYVGWRGVIGEANKRYEEATSELYRKKMESLMKIGICTSCHGDRIDAYPAATKFREKRFPEITALPTSEALLFFQNIALSEGEKAVGEELIKEICERLSFLNNVGLHYLSLDRYSPSLSGGEAQRVRLASQIGAGIVGATYVLDEPSIGLHPIDNGKLLDTLKRLRDKGNNILVVEHDEETIYEADHIIDVGPKAGAEGGEIVAEGSVKKIIAAKNSLTGAYLSKRLALSPLTKKRRQEEMLTIKNATHHNLKGIDLSIPLKNLVCVVGVSGSGKSSLITETLYPALANALHHGKMEVGKHGEITGTEHIDKVIAIDQAPIGRTPRSNPATYIKLFDEIRDLFYKLPESQSFGYLPGRFSFNVKEGSCLHCKGMGMIKIDMDFMEDEWISCEHCQGRRFDEKTLSITYKGKNIHDILEMEIAKALPFFSAFPKIEAKLKLLVQVGLGYMKIGQPSPTLSGGEAQRIKLAKELSRPSTGKTLYILDEPTTGLHFADIDNLCKILQALVEKGNTVLIIEHNTDLMRIADWIIELGPEGGKGGGEIIAKGTPETIEALNTSTGIALRKTFAPKEKKKKRATKEHALVVQEVSQNNLKEVSATIPRNEITICTGPSGSGKSSFAFETIYAEGQRRYTESMSNYTRQFVQQMAKPKFSYIDGLSPSIAIEQKAHAGNPRSTLGTMTESYDFLRILFAHLGVAYCPETGEKIRSISKEYIAERLLALPEKSRLRILSPITLKRSDSFASLREKLQKEGFLRIRLNDTYYELDEKIPFNKRQSNALALVIDRIILSPDVKNRLLEAIEGATSLSGGTLIVDTGDEDLFFNLSFSSEKSGKSYLPITPHTFSFNTPEGMCPDCLGLGVQYGANILSDKLIASRLYVSDLLSLLFKERSSHSKIAIFIKMLKKLGVDDGIPIGELPPEALQILMNGSKEKIDLGNGVVVSFRGINFVFSKAAKIGPKNMRQEILPLLKETKCLSCQGSRLNPLATHVKIGEKTIADLCAMPVREVYSFLSSLSLSKKENFLQETLRQLLHKLHFIQEIGLHYLSLNRSAPTLSGGETQRVRLSRQLGSGLTGCLYVLDEPTIGLHPHNNALLQKALFQLKEMKNTLLLVEHDPQIIAISDYLLDFGPQAGIHGGEIIARGTPKEIQNNPSSLTGNYLSGKKELPIPTKRRSSKTSISIKNGTMHNLKNISVEIPLGLFTCISGVSGSGKSTLIHHLLRPALEESLATRGKKTEVEINGSLITGLSQIEALLVMDQKPIGHTSRANVSTYTDLLTPLRGFFAALPLAKAKGLQPKNFSFNHLKGMCKKCMGLGIRKVNMQFLPPVEVICEGCQGFRLNNSSLQVLYEGLHLGNILKMTIEEATEFLPPIPKIEKILSILLSVGLGYLTLDQSIESLSGGEAQRLRLSKELAKSSRKKTLYLFDEPTIGLHPQDIEKLLPIFHEIVERKNTLVIIEHNLDILANADHIIDLGPEAGELGGELITHGTPEEVAKHPSSYTAKYLKERIRK